MTQEITTIQFKRALNYLTSEKQIIPEIANLILEYGEPLFLIDIGYLVIGDGVWSDPSSNSGTLTGHTVKELIKSNKYFSIVQDPRFKGDATFEPDESSIYDPTTKPGNSTLANTWYVQAAIEYWNNQLKAGLVDSRPTGSLEPGVGNTITFFKETDGKISIKFEKIAINYNQINGAGPSGATPLMDGIATPGTINNWSRENHVHPTDTSRAPINSPAFTGSPTAPNPTTNINEKIATTGYVDTSITAYREPKTAVAEGNLYVTGVTEENGELKYHTSVYVNAAKGILMGAAWNDFAEYRKCDAKPGDVVCETGKGDLKIAKEKMQAGACVVSDTYGMVIGPQGEDYVPIAVAGRVLAKYSGDLKDYGPGDAVCADKGGKIAKMTREEIMYFPDRIVGYVSEIPEYKTWNHVKINDRIWIKVK